MNVREAVVPAFVTVGELEVIHSQQVQERGVEVVHTHRVAGDVVAEVVGRSVHDAGLEAAAGRPNREAAGMMVAPEAVFLDLALAVSGAAKLSAQMTMVSFSRPRCFRSFTSAAAAWSTSFALTGIAPGRPP